MSNALDNFFKKQDKDTKVALSISALGLLLFLGVAFTAPFSANVFSQLFPKAPSQAATGTEVKFENG